jgi:hypothetical protein
MRASDKKIKIYTTLSNNPRKKRVEDEICSPSSSIAVGYSAHILFILTSSPIR